MTARGIIIGCYTPGAVAHEHLIPSAKRLGLDYAVEPMPDRGSWILNNSACQLHLRCVLPRYADRDILYCDVDAVIHSDQWPLLAELPPCDVAAHIMPCEHNGPGGLYAALGGELLSGTLFLPASGRRAALLEDWIAHNEARPDVWDQRNLQTILSTPGCQYRLARLPAELCFIFDLHRRLFPYARPIIEHFQASRRYKHKR